MKHTAEPWVLMLNHGEPYAILPAGRQGTICSFCAPFPKEEDIKRAISCVNACANIPDPEAIPKAISLLKEAALEIQYLHDKLHTTTGSGNAVLVRIDALLAELEVK